MDFVLAYRNSVRKVAWSSTSFLYTILVASGEKLGFQITLLLSSYIYFDVFQDLLPPFERTTDTPAALIFFIVLIIVQFFTIIGTDSTCWRRTFLATYKIFELKILSSTYFLFENESCESVFMGATPGN